MYRGPKEGLRRLFEEFYRATNAKRMLPHGTGLGLAICKRIAEAHHGEIEVESEEGMAPGLLAATQGRFATTKRGRARPIGLGLALLRQTAEMCGGGLRVLSRPGGGTLVEAQMRRSHIDRPPVGDCVTTVLGLVVGNPCVGFRFTHCVQGRCHAFDSRTARRALGVEGLQRPEVMGWIRRELERGERDLAEMSNAECDPPLIPPLDEIERRELDNVEVRTVGSLGLENVEPVITVEKEGEEPVTYGNLDAASARRVIA